ncbi:MAG TPA: hypothetical protein VJT33_04195 [bacterium]|nr:hypothetical protein [bacterium]
MSKRRDALRRGIRDLIQDTSRDLIAFEGREPRPRPAAPPDSESEARISRRLVPDEGNAGAPSEAPALNGGPLDAADRSAAAAESHALPPAPARTPPDHEGEADLLTGEPPVPQRPSAAPPEPAPPEPVRPPRPPLELTMPPAFARPIVPTDRLTPDAAAAPKARSADRRTADGRPQARAAAKKRKAARARRPAVSKGRIPALPRGTPGAPADDVVAEDAGPAPAESRTGVCRSYFINHECWRVPAAYCNTALQVCVIRSCPVYHLHKDALERRFAKKYKHFW